MSFPSLLLAFMFVAAAGCGGSTADSSSGPTGGASGGSGGASEAEGGPGDSAGIGGGGGGADAGTGGGGDAGGGSPDAGPDGGSCPAKCGTPGCPPCAGPAMVVGHTDQWGDYRIDSTEVTNAQYAEFLAAAPDPSAQPAFCSWNTTFAPRNDTDCSWLHDPLNRADYPVVCVNWCDARAYCEWTGKRLCQHLNGKLARTEISGEWAIACTHVQMTTFPYGDTYEPKACNGKDYGAGKVVPVASLPGCVGGLPGLYDMSGNAHEWNGACVADNGPDDMCSVAGGSYLEANPDLLECTPGSLARRASTAPSIGFRCCAD